MLDFPRSSGRREIRIRNNSGKKEIMLLGWCGAGARFGVFNQTRKPSGSRRRGTLERFGGQALQLRA